MPNSPAQPGPTHGQTIAYRTLRSCTCRWCGEAFQSTAANATVCMKHKCNVAARQADAERRRKAAREAYRKRKESK